MEGSIRELQQIRRRSLTVNEICQRWISRKSDLSALATRTALVTWRLARVITGWLQAFAGQTHPRLFSFSEFALCAGVSSISLTHLSQSSRLHWLQEQLDGLDHAMASLLALTSSAGIRDRLFQHHADLKSLKVLLHEQLLAAEWDAPPHAGVLGFSSASPEFPDE